MIKKLKKIFTFTVLLLTVGLYAQNFQEIDEDRFSLVADNENLELYLDEKNGFLAVKQLDTETVWYSSPLDWEKDTESSGFNKNAVPSLLSIRTKDTKSSRFPANSYINVVKRKTLEIEEIDNGVRLLHVFKREGIEIPVDITIDDASVVFSVPLNEIKEWADDELDLPEEEREYDLRLLDFSLAPFFGAASANEKGYFFVPDGTGALINFTNNKSLVSYQQYIYGRDPSIIPSMKKTVAENIAFPVFGISKENSGLLAVVDGCPGRAYITAETAGQKTGYNTVYASCIYRDYDTVSFRERTGTPREIPVFGNPRPGEEVFSVRFLFLDSEKKDYVAMANAYRSYLQSVGKFPENLHTDNVPLVLNFIGSSLKKQPVLGIPANTEIPYTTFKDIIDVVGSLKEKGVDNFIIKIDGWLKGGILANYPDKAKPETKLGGKKDFLELVQFLKDNNILFYLGADFVNLYKSDLAHLKELNVNRAVNKMPVEIPDYRMTTYRAEKSTNSNPYWILRTGAVTKYYNKFIKSFEKYNDLGLGLAPDSLGNVVSNDFGTKKSATRDECVTAFQSLLLSTAETTPLFLSRPFDYALNSISFAADLPTVSSKFDIENVEVPFYQILLHGYIPFSNLPGNRSLNYREYVMKLLETGASPSYLWITRNPEKMRDTRVEAFVNVYAPDWIDEAADVYLEVSDLLNEVANVPVVEHSVISKDIRKTVYENGIGITFDYEKKSYSVTREETR